MKRARDEEKSHDNKCKKLCKDKPQDLVVKDGDILNASIRTIVNASMKEKKIARHHAAANGHVEIVKVLIHYLM